MKKIAAGMSTSSLTAGFVFFTYYSVYNHLLGSGNRFAGCIASFVTSFIKLPIGNSMRLMQSGVGVGVSAKGTTDVLTCGRHLYRQKKLYNGYMVSLLEDTIEMDVKTRMYSATRRLSQSQSQDQDGKTATCQQPSIAHTVIQGAFAGAVSSGLTTPFDTIKTHLCVNKPTRGGPLHVAHSLCKTHGFASLFRGVHMRVASNALKSAAFFTAFELLSFM